MGKSKKKKQNSDFQKVKLKVGKRKPVGTNVTDTTFKSASINVHTQLEEKLQPTNRKNLTLKELLIHLNHYNANIRQDSLSGLKDLFIKHPDIISRDLSIWLSKVVEKLVDPDVLVRQTLCNCLTFTFTNLTENDLKPFIKIIIAHVCCGMTHINEAIQLDTLSILEILIDRFPVLIYPHIDKLLPNFLDLISKKSNNTDSKKKMGKSKIISNLVSRDFNDGKLASLKNQCKVFGKLLKMLNLIKDFQYSKISNGTRKKDPPSFRISSTGPASIPLLRIKYNCNIDLNVMDLLNERKSDESSNDNCNFNEFYHTVFQVLINAWVEHEPSVLESGINDSKSLQNIYPGMMTIIKLFDILFLLLGNADIKSNMQDFNWFKDFSNHFLKYFVLSIDLPKSSNRSKGISQNKTSKGQELALSYNFLAAKSIIMVLKTDRQNENRSQNEKLTSQYYKKLMTFLMITLEGSCYLSFDLVNDLCDILFQVFDMRSSLKSIINADEIMCDTTKILDSLIDIFIKASLASPWKVPLLHFFMKLVDGNKSKAFIQEEFSSKIRSFTINIISNIWSIPSTSSGVINESLKYIKMVLVRSFLNKKEKIMLESSIIKMTELKNGFSFCELSAAIQKSILDIIYYLDCCSEQLVKNICKITQHSSVCMETKEDCVSMLANCVSKTVPTLSMELFISFVLSLSVGYTVKELQEMNMSNETVISWSMLNIFEDSGRTVPVQYAIDHIRGLSDTKNNLWKILLPNIGKLLVMFRRIPYTSASGLIMMLENLSRWYSDEQNNEEIDSEINQIVDLILASLLFCSSHSYKDLVKKETESKESIDNFNQSCINVLHFNGSILKQLVTKSINTLNEYKMNKDCVKSIMEFLLNLLQDEKLRFKMVPFKSDLCNVLTLLNNPSIEQQHLFQQFNLQLSIL